ncbi:2-hydroxyglutaryl-CoA dehydratase component A [Anaerotruncus sp. 2789STDY5834896]|uniref:2-hydroxyglutaryl-CoA dehydratase component A n=1 Tax=uncultured Anaerotruncus sp. TaxID=905011 RepID=A0A1C6H924_9FIRM|nr:2-hydroxyglutaryl-CoA dehydratase component A [uncultured Anaerotruncus sp.]
MSYKIGLDVGSTTIKVVVLDTQDNLVYKSYERHRSRVREMALEKIQSLKELLTGHHLRIAITGSAGLGMAKESGIDFVQEVYATAGAVRQYVPSTDVVIELGGEDAKIIFLKGALEERMNSTCAGGTGAFIDQMASLLNVDLAELDRLSLAHDRIYPIASRCGVFAKTDIQPLINQGAQPENIAASIFQAVVDQTIAGLAQGREIEGNVLFLGGPLSFLKGLQERFIKTLELDGESANFHPLAPYFVALGAALYSKGLSGYRSYDELEQIFTQVLAAPQEVQGMEPLFADEQEYQDFCDRHAATAVEQRDLSAFSGRAFLGVDAGSTTTKTVLLDEDYHILYSDYVNNLGNPITAVKRQLDEIYSQAGPDLTIAGAAVTGYGEDLIRAAFHLDFGVVETMAHFTAAKHFDPAVDFIIDIGGQDMKCFKIKDDTIDDIVLNEACSSGCGSFIETFAKSLGYPITEFATLGLFAKHPVDLGTRCTVFMNSSVKQAQKNGATVEDISAGLAMSVVKNALYKVIRARSADDIGQNIVVQGGTFLNDSVLRSFEKELGRKVVRPAIAGLMGAFGAAIWAMRNAGSQSTVLTAQQLAAFTHQSKATVCGICTNHCNLTVNTFSDGSRFIAGNRCERPVTGKKADVQLPNMVAYKYKKLMSYTGRPGPRGQIGLPMCLNSYENLPFWHTFFTELGFEVVTSGRSTKQMYLKGQNTIPSDTVCYPAKLVHGHIRTLLEKGVKTIFYPCMSYNFDESISQNCYNCPVVAYYPELIKGNVPMDGVQFIYPYISLNDKKIFEQKIIKYLNEYGFALTKKEVQQASEKAYAAYDAHRADICEEGMRALRFAKDHHKKTVVLAGRPYHIDPEINHGIDKLLSSLGFVVVTEDCVANLANAPQTNVLNQWTYHARMYNAARYVSHAPGTELVQLVSFGCGLDAITTDEVRDILRESDKLYTQLKIDEIDNLGAIKIRLRSLLAAMDEREKEHAN